MDFTISLEQQASLLSMEAFNVKASMQAVTRVFPSFARNVQDKLKTFLATEPPMIPAVKPLSIAKLKSINFAAHRKTQVYGPLGLKVTYGEDLHALDASIDVVTQLQEKQVGALTQFANGLLAEPGRFNSARSDKPVLPFGEDTIVECRKKIDKCVDRASTQSIHEYGKLFRNNTEVHIATEQVNGMIDRYLRVNREELIQSVADCVDVLERMADRLEHDDSFKPNGATLSALTQGILTTAKLVEFFSVTGFLLAEVAGCVQETNKGVERLA